MKKRTAATEAYERLLAVPAQDLYVLRLFVVGMTPRSMAAITALKGICEQHLRNRYDLEVIDLYQHPALAKDEQIVAAPTLIRKLPQPERKLIGNLSDKARVLSGLDLHGEA